MKPWHLTCILPLLAAIGAAETHPAAAGEPDPPRWTLGAGVNGGILVGESSDYLDTGPGVDAHAGYRLDPSGHVRGALRLAFLDVRAEDSGAARADNALLSALLGPEFLASLWRMEAFFSPRIGGVWSFMTFDGPSAPPARIDTGFGWGIEGGLRIRVSNGPRPWSLEILGRILDPDALDFASASPPYDPDRPEGARAVERDVAVLLLGVGLQVGFP